MITLASFVIDPITLLIIAAGIIGLGFSFWSAYKTKRIVSENNNVAELANKIKEGVTTFVVAEYKFLALFIVSLSILAFFYGKSQEGVTGMLALSIIIGGLSSLAASYFSKQFTVNANEKVISENQKTYSDGFKTAFLAGISAGVVNTAFVIIGVIVLFLVLGLMALGTEADQLFLSVNSIVYYLGGYALGTSSVALFMRLGGSVFERSVDMAEDEIVGSKTGITKNSSYNPASTANETGQVVSNAGGIGADMHESFTIGIIACMLLGTGLISPDYAKSVGLMALPFVIASIGIFTSIAGSYLLRSSEVSTSRKAINIAEGFAAIVLSIGTFLAIKYMLPAEWEVTRTTDKEIITTTYKGLGIFWSVFFGIAASVGIGYITSYFTSKDSRTVKNLAGESKKGVANNILGSAESGLIFTGIPMAIILAVVLASYYFAGFYGVGLATVGYLGNMALQMAFNAFAPIADNSNSIASKAALGDVALRQTNDLKQTGIQSIAQGKTFLAVAASLVSISVFSAFIQLTSIFEINLVKPLTISFLIIGALLPFLFSSNALAAVRRVSKKVVNEITRQFDEIPALNDANEILDKYNGDLTYATEGEKEIVYSATDSADNNQCVEVATYSTIWETLIPGAIAIAVPVLIAYLGGTEMLAAMLLGVITTGTIMALSQAHKGSILENTKNALEEGTVYNGELIGKESNAYQASLEGDKVGQPVKDASASAMTVLMKIILITALVMVPLLVNRASKKKALKLDGLSKVEQVDELAKEKLNS